MATKTSQSDDVAQLICERRADEWRVIARDRLRAPAVNVVVLESGTAARAPATVNRHLAAVFGF